MDRKRYRINVPTYNSFYSLSNESENEELDVSPINRSCPELTRACLECSTIIENLKAQLQSLEQKLASAEIHIEELLIEKYSLKSKLNDSELKSNFLKNICNSTEKRSPASNSISSSSIRRNKYIKRTNKRT
ncbi:hypothetical protein O0L34_g16577 [Tuta absoluta]|nr:hypothetical protein O0L34_g16577 [Tuta absoluta]